MCFFANKVFIFFNIHVDTENDSQSPISNDWE